MTTISEQTERKIKLESTFRREVRTLFSRIRIEFRVSAATGRPVRASKYWGEWESALITHYRRVQRAFRGVVTSNVKQIDNDEVLAALIAWIEKSAPWSAEKITETTQRNMDDALTQARQAFSDEGKADYTDRELALAAAVILGRKFTGRESTIVMSETQRAAESTKLIEAYSVAGIPAIAAVTGERVVEPDAIKMWVTVGDERVRRSHRLANGQKVNLADAFRVKGQILMYPGDNSKGATMDNTSGCRCSAFYEFRG